MGRRSAEFVKRTAFALLASLALHDKKSGDAPFLERLPLIEAAATRRAQFRQEGRQLGAARIGGRKSPALRAAARELADRLAASSDKTAKWVGRDAQKAFAKADADQILAMIRVASHPVRIGGCLIIRLSRRPRRRCSEIPGSRAAKCRARPRAPRRSARTSTPAVSIDDASTCPSAQGIGILDVTLATITLHVRPVQTRSITIAMPCPTPMHIVQSA